MTKLISRLSCARGATCSRSAPTMPATAPSVTAPRASPASSLPPVSDARPSSVISRGNASANPERAATRSPTRCNSRHTRRASTCGSNRRIGKPSPSTIPVGGPRKNAAVGTPRRMRIWKRGASRSCANSGCSRKSSAPAPDHPPPDGKPPPISLHYACARILPIHRRLRTSLRSACPPRAPGSSAASSWTSAASWSARSASP